MDTDGRGEKALGGLVLRPQPGSQQNWRTAWDRPSLGPGRHLDLRPQPPERPDEKLPLSRAPSCGRLCGSEASTPPGETLTMNPKIHTTRTQRSGETGARRPWITPSSSRGGGAGAQGTMFQMETVSSRPPERLPEPPLCTNNLCLFQKDPKGLQNTNQPGSISSTTEP